jgi:hypothetical protein
MKARREKILNLLTTQTAFGKRSEEEQEQGESEEQEQEQEQGEQELLQTWRASGHWGLRLLVHPGLPQVPLPPLGMILISML